jgi:hypothetical protein
MFHLWSLAGDAKMPFSLTHCRQLLLLIALSMYAGTCTAANNQRRPNVLMAKGMEHFHATRFFVANEMNLVFDLHCGNFDADPQNEVLVVGSDGFRLVTLDGRVKSFTAFPTTPVWSARAIRLPDGRGFGFVVSLPDQQRIAMYDRDGKMVWSSPSRKYTDLTVIDLEADGSEEVLAAGEGLKVYGNDGKLLRTFSEDFCVSAAVLADDTKQSKLVAAVLWNAGRLADTVTVFSADGTIVRTWQPPFEFYKFGAVPLPAEKSGLMFLDVDAIKLFDAEGKLIKTLDAPGARALSIPIGRKLRSRDNKDTLIATATGKGSAHRHTVFAYSDDFELIHVSHGEGDALAVLTVDSEQAEGDSPFFLVGARGEIWKYTER